MSEESNSEGSASNFKGDVFQMQTPIYSGNSGGPLLNNHGNLIGINTFFNIENPAMSFAVTNTEIIRFLLDWMKALLNKFVTFYVFIQFMVVIFLVIMSSFYWFNILLNFIEGRASKDDYLIFFVLNCFYSFSYLAINALKEKNV